jgi:hypothetical protein
LDGSLIDLQISILSERLILNLLRNSNDRDCLSLLQKIIEQFLGKTPASDPADPNKVKTEDTLARFHLLVEFFIGYSKGFKNFKPNNEVSLDDGSVGGTMVFIRNLAE